MRRLASGAALLVALLGTAALAGADKVAFPEGYEQEYLHYGSVDRESNMAQISELFANDVAVSGIKESGELPMGSVLVMELHNAQLEAEKPVLGDDGRRIKEKLGVIAVMEKCEGCGEEYPEEIRNGNWEYAFFDPQTKALVDRDYESCFECHKPLADQDFVFSIEELKEAVAAM